MVSETRESESMPVTLANLVDRQVTIEWHEAVAIVQQLGDTLRRLGTPMPAVADLSLVQITAEGEVRVLPGRLAERPADDLVSVLRTLLPTEHPVQLRLLVDMPSSGSTTPNSIEEWSTSLEYFERPGRADVIREVYQRFLATPPRRSARQAAREEPNEAARPKRHVQKSWKTRAAWVAVAVIASTVLVGITGMFVLRQGQEREGGEPTLSTLTAEAWTLIEELGETVRGVTSSSLAALSQQVGLAGPDAPDAGAGISPPEGPSAPPVPSVRPARSRPGARSRTPAAARESHDTGVVAGVVPAEEGERVTSEIGLPIFTSNDIGVTPPVAVRPRIRAVPQDAAERDVMGVVEAIVSTNGTVESVKLVASTTVHHAMILSAVKTWTFRPATKDGQPVRFRHFIPIP